MTRLVLILHLIGASIWVGGHLVLLFTIVPEALRKRDAELVRNFEQRYERIGVPALIVQLLTGLWLAHRYVPGVIDAFHFSDHIQIIIAIKLLLLLATVITGAHARLFIIPKLTAERLPGLAVHISLVTVFAVTLLALGATVKI